MSLKAKKSSPSQVSQTPATPQEAREALLTQGGEPPSKDARASQIAENQAEMKLAPSVLTIRRRWGYGLVCLGIVGAVCGFWSAKDSLAAIARIGPISTEHEHVVLGVLVAKGVLSSAYFAFCYALVRAGERMTVPAWWLVTGEDRRAVMGAKESAAPKSVRDLVDKLIDALGKK